MSSPRRNVRPLGSVNRYNATHNEKLPKLKAVHSLDTVLHGSALAVPPVKTPPEKPDPVRVVVRSPRNHSSSSSTKSDESPRKPNLANEKIKRDLKESLEREKQLKLRIEELESLVDELRRTIEALKNQIKEQRDSFNRQEAEYVDLLEKEKEAHNVTKTALKDTRDTLDVKITCLKQQEKEYEEQIKTINITKAKEIETMRMAKDKEISDLNEKLNKMKKQMADTFKGNSWERQQQLDELTKELQKIQDESDMLRIKLKQSKNLKSGTCGNSESMSTKANEKDKKIKELNALCTKLEKQLQQQDVLLKQFAQRQGKKL